MISDHLFIDKAIFVSQVKPKEIFYRSINIRVILRILENIQPFPCLNRNCTLRTYTHIHTHMGLNYI